MPLPIPPAAAVYGAAIQALREWPAFVSAGVLVQTPEQFDADDPWPEQAPAIRLTPKASEREFFSTRNTVTTWKEPLDLTVEVNDPSGQWGATAALAAEVVSALVDPDNRDALEAAGCSEVQFPVPPDWETPGRVRFITYRRER